MASERLLQAIMVTTELTGTELSQAAANVFAEDLSRYPEHQVLRALTRCRREVKGRLTLADVIRRIDDGRPGPEEAWAAIPKSESETVVWTAEMATAFAAANPLLLDDDKIAARMTFLETYKRELANARDNGESVSWIPSLGHDSAGRDDVIMQAHEARKLTHKQAVALLPHLETEIKALPGREKVEEMHRQIKQTAKELKVGNTQ